MRELKLLLRKDLWILKNNLLLILKNPLRLLPYLVLVGYFTFIYSQRIKSRRNTSEMGIEGVNQIDYSVQNIVGAITLLVLGFLIFQLFRATKYNVTFFKMADVNLLFPAPVRPQNLLLYYMIRSLIPSLGGAVLFMVYGGSQLAGDINLNLISGTFMVLGFALFFFMIFPIRFLVYTLHTKYGIMEYIRFGVVALGIVLGLMVVIPGFMADKFWQGMFSWIASPWFDFFPLVGWSRGILSFTIHGNWVISTGFILLYVLSFYTVLRLVIQFSGYYYEDVLEATKSNEEKLEKARGKKEITEDTYSLNAKKQLALPDFGIGAKAFYWRNYVHSSRQDFHPLVGVYSLSLAGIGILMAGLSNFEWFSHKVLYFYLILLMGIYFMAGIGRANIGDLKKPWFILVPASWAAKFWNMIKLDLIQIAIFSALLIIPSVFLAQVSIGLIPLFLLGMICSYLIGLSINLIPQVALEESWDRFLIKPLMIGGIFIFGIIPALALGILVFIVLKKFIWTLLVIVLGFVGIAAILLHVVLDVLKRLEFKEL
ncbi:putative ABC exporter domain-containing protein [Algoriphagus mannitolivorans]|uniref:putative ABC exporter domain-containing protein n=1 Tax=Algoriphagus mannitolivorans TaxID=226504 RepID=UPI000413EB82|nr:putative ABC exporter domain-containing protein [Algoriphagus mannitolivorans]